MFHNRSSCTIRRYHYQSGHTGAQELDNTTQQHILVSKSLMTVPQHFQMKFNIKTSGWKTAEKNTLIPHDLESYPFYFKTTSLVGSEDWIKIKLFTTSLTKSYINTTVRLDLSSDPPYVRIDDCAKGSSLNTNLK